MLRSRLRVLRLAALWTLLASPRDTAFQRAYSWRLYRKGTGARQLGVNSSVEWNNHLVLTDQPKPVADHLLGKVFVEYLSPLKQDRIKTRLKKRKAKAA